MNCRCSMKTKKNKKIYEYIFDVISKWVEVAQSSTEMILRFSSKVVRV